MKERKGSRTEPGGGGRCRMLTTSCARKHSTGVAPIDSDGLVVWLDGVFA